MIDLLQTAEMMPHGYCLLWNSWLLALHAISDMMIFVSYFLIPLAILQFLRARPDVRLGGVSYLFVAFILLCGLTHLVGFVTLWYPVYELQGVVKLMTALVSATTAAIIFPMVPKLAALPSPAQLRAANAELENEVASHRETLAELNLSRIRLEAEVENRTRELSEANERLTVMLHETAHRAKNLLTVVQSIARQTAAHAETKEEVVEALSGRMASLAKALTSVIESGAGNADLGDMIETQLAHVRDSYPGRIMVNGPPLPVRLEAAQQIGLAIHELATNAVKYGALSHPEGRVEVRWALRDPESDDGIELEWREWGGSDRGGKGTAGEGLGSLLLNRAVPMQLRAEVRSDFTEDGYRYGLVIPAKSLTPRNTVDRTDDVARAFPLTGGSGGTRRSA